MDKVEIWLNNKLSELEKEITTGKVGSKVDFEMLSILKENYRNKNCREFEEDSIKLSWLQHPESMGR